ncbi:MAG: hypothetical protein IKE46_08035 [Selenomonadaceae bacterium]|nr:hypothetical protein [Selenomonadaceae bacterium]MBR4384147.1 hypothetical protein [Selenomonadaceae bacterium]
MWEKDGENLIVDKRNNVEFFITVAMIFQDKYEQRIEGFFDTVDEAKAALEKKYAELKAEEEAEPWQIADDGNAYFGENKIFRVEVKDDKQSFGYVVLHQNSNAGNVYNDFLGFRRTDDDARNAIVEFVDVFNARA